MSLDGFVAGPNVDLERPMGDHGGPRLHGPTSLKGVARPVILYRVLRRDSP